MHNAATNNVIVMASIVLSFAVDCHMKSNIAIFIVRITNMYLHSDYRYYNVTGTSDNFIGP